MTTAVKRWARRRSSAKSLDDVDRNALLKSFTEQQYGEVTDREAKLAERIWEYMLMKHPLKRSDVIMVLGNFDVRTAEYASRLWLDGWGDWLLLSGNLGRMTKGRWEQPEYQVFRDVAVKMGVPENKILLEELATNTGENIHYSYRVLEANDLRPQVITLIQTPFMERRALATFRKQWPGDLEKVTVYVHSPEVSFSDFARSDICTQVEVIALMLGCLHRIREYPKLGFMEKHAIPSAVWASHKELVASGKYSAHLLTVEGKGKENVAEKNGHG